MTFTQFSMIEELASLVKDNLPSKHLILSVEELLVNFLEEDTSVDRVLELEPMNPYNRLLVHRLADIFGFSHQSVGEGESRHLVLERCLETSMPPILVSDLVLQFDERQPSMTFDEPRWNEVMPGQSNTALSKSSFEERETSYIAARERIFSSDARETKMVKERPKYDPVVARRMITHALGHSDKATQHEPSSNDAKDATQAANGMKFQYTEYERDLCGRDELGKNSTPRTCETSKEGLSKNSIKRSDDCLRNEHMGAAKRLFANALGMHPRDANHPKCDGTRNSSC
ncbi:DNA-directed RNA polymerase subunit alpha [Striga asiatica]|uniref:DNA-directed RNA polymerase subunit alpha n=1 Tax=Striga asiatica TaxID=4170 RepID=A0A5A7QE33_STRAF|nr:DNA-directed RNA polymerase subunit alpha [Striga asiatica]